MKYNKKMKSKYIVIKYKIDGEFIEDCFYDLILVYDKCTQILTLEDDATISNPDKFLKSLDSTMISMQYKGISKVDNCPIFIIDEISTKRSINLDKIL